MVAVYSISLVFGVVLVVPFAIGAGARPGLRPVAAGLLGFGLGGMSASFAGWPWLGALVAALVAGGAMVLISTYLRPPGADEGEA